MSSPWLARKSRSSGGRDVRSYLKAPKEDARSAAALLVETKYDTFRSVAVNIIYEPIPIVKYSLGKGQTDSKSDAASNP